VNARFLEALVRAAGVHFFVGLSKIPRLRVKQLDQISGVLFVGKKQLLHLAPSFGGEVDIRVVREG